MICMIQMMLHNKIQDLIRKLLLVDPARRMDATQAMEHPWLCTTGPSFAQNNLGKNLEQLRIFNATRKLRAAIKSVSDINIVPAVFFFFLLVDFVWPSNF